VRDPGERPRIDPKQATAAGLAIGLGFGVVASLLISIGGGLLLDRWLDTTPWLTLVGVLIGILAAGSQLYRLARSGR
jgi:ATP synthase protein I